MGPLLKDRHWIRQAFQVSSDDLDQVDIQNRTFSSASLKFTDTTPGGNFAINPLPQFTRFCDPKPQDKVGRVTLRRGGPGMGRYYSEAIDDHMQLVHFRMGVPAYNSLTTFFTGFYNSGAGQLARTGRAPDAFYQLGKAAGFVVTIMSWKLLAVSLIGYGARFFLEKPSSKFFYHKPTMPLFWQATATILNQIMVNKGVVPRLGGNENARVLGDQYEFGASELERLHNELPDIFMKGGGIDVYAMANRAQRLARQHMKLQEAAFKDAAAGMDIRKKIQEINQTDLRDTGPKPYNGAGPDGKQVEPGLLAYLQRWFQTDQSKSTVNGDGETDGAAEAADKSTAKNAGFLDFLMAELDDGAAFATFRVNATGPTQESFTSQVTESEIANKINSISSASRSANFNFAGGNVVGGAVGSLIGGAFGAVKSFGSGLLDSLELSGLGALGGGAFVDIPKHWQSSSAQLPRMNYTMNLVSPYGNPISQLINLYVPLSMLLAMSLPISTGRQSYTSPFLVQVFDQGRAQTRLGIVDSLTISRGVGNTGWSQDGHALAIEVNLSIMDLSSVLHMPISQGFSMGATLGGSTIGSVIGGAVGTTGGVAGVAGGAAVGAAAGAAAGTVVDGVTNVVRSINSVFDDETSFSDYMAILGGVSLADQIYPWRKLKLRLTQNMQEWKSWYSASHYASVAGDVFPARLVSAIFKGTAR